MDRPSSSASDHQVQSTGAGAYPDDDNAHRLRFLTDNVPTVMLYQLLIDRSGKRRFTYVSGGVQSLHALSPEQVLADPDLLYGQIHPDDRARVREAECASCRDCSLFELEIRSASAHGTRWLLLRSVPRRLQEGGMIWDGVEIDITASKEQEEVRAQLEESLRHAQRLESVGRLAGGVAHDFNNMLTAILGNLAMAQLELAPSDSAREHLEEAISAARAAENLTRQLLAFSRKQVVVPKVLSLNEVAERVRKMLGRVLGEDVELRTELTFGISQTRADPGQVEQILVNLAVNARDAMPAGGSVTLATRDVVLADTEAARLELEPGPYVLLSVSDNGTGMSEDVKARLFEPFFTTKGVGKGTGLGLSMVYGAIKQSGGGIDVRSELGRGTEFRLYWPRVSDSQISVRPPPLPALERGSETIMVVEDEQMVRALASTILERQGYHVVACSSGAEALALMKSLERQPVDLLLTDLVMPGMSGRELAERVVSQRPSVRVLYTSGYTEDAVIHRGIADDDMQFLAKPYSVQELSRRVREVLDASARS